ncbi:hypothetical protein J2S74_003799 [Evansella vedderi]|uniref:WxL domain-containing protein n=1 Tax=Evansella vedderi TaxID=38282 RepID=A0ABT9ZYQ9_9BACI|nr:WxL domain-containing protein [Evansella vedderi]MDQ0256379.1 hypothetical protein [Evansella vedderi]
MFALYRKSTRKYFVLLLGILFTIIFINMSSVKSSETSIHFSVSSGTLHVQASKENVSLKINEEGDVAYGDVGKLTIVDATGSGEGWKLTLKSTPIKKLEKNNRNKDDGIKGTLFLLAQKANIQEGEGSSSPPKWVGNQTYPINGNFPVKVLSANQGEGMGTYYIDFGIDSLKFQLPENINTNTYYETTLIWNVVSGP